MPQCKQIPVRNYNNFTYTIFGYSFTVSVPVQNRHLQVETLSQFLTCLASKVLKLTSYIVHGYSLCRKIGCAEDLIAPTGIGMDDLANME